MDPRLLRFYNQELRYLRDMGAEFARDFPKIAGRLGIDGIEVADPYVERLLEGAAFLAARVQLKLDAEFPRLSQRLLEILYPNFLAPVPSMLVAHFEPLPDPNLVQGYELPRGTALHGARSTVSATRCRFHTAQAVVLTPLRVTAADFFQQAPDLAPWAQRCRERPRCGVRLRLQLPEAMACSALAFDRLRFHLAGAPEIAARLHELILSSAAGVVVGAPGKAGDAGRLLLPPEALQPVGYEDDEALLPVVHRRLAGTRLMQEYFAFARRFMFFDIAGLREAFARCPQREIEIAILFSRPVQGLDGAVDAGNFLLHCAPAINLFPMRADRIEIAEAATDLHLVADRSAPLDFEIYDVADVTGFTADNREMQFRPFYAVPRERGIRHGYYTIEREPRLPSDKVRREGPRSGYVGAEVYLSLVDPDEAPFGESLRQLAAKVRCTNRDLPVFMPVGDARGDLLLDVDAPLAAIRIVAGPSRPWSPLRDGPVAWRLINLLGLNNLSLVDTDAEQGAAALRELLALFAQSGDAAAQRQIEGLRSVASRPVVRRHPAPGPIAFGRGIEVTLTVDDLAFEGASAFLFGSVLHRYLARHASMNSFVETALLSQARGPIGHWDPLPCDRAIL